MEGACRREAEAALAGMEGRRILVVGDLVADHYLFGRPARISREAPVLILRWEGEEIVPGAAGNAAQNVRALGGEVYLVGAVGDDPAGRALLAALEARGIELDGVIRTGGWPTATKTRILAGGGKTVRQQVVRIDRQAAEALAPPVREALAREAAALLPRVDACIISDYGLGAVGPEMRQALLGTRGGDRPPVAVDARYDLLAYRGVDVATPNQFEAEAAVGRPLREPGDVVAAGRELLRRLACSTVLITQGDEGMTLVEEQGGAGGAAVHIQAVEPAEVFDVTGAGDTVIGAFTLALAAGTRPFVAALIANLAAGLVVRKLGAATVTPGELRAALARWRPVWEPVEAACWTADDRAGETLSGEREAWP